MTERRPDMYDPQCAWQECHNHCPSSTQQEGNTAWSQSASSILWHPHTYGKCNLKCRAEESGILHTVFWFLASHWDTFLPLSLPLADQRSRQNLSNSPLFQRSL